MPTRHTTRLVLASASVLVLGGCASLDFEDDTHPLTRTSWQLSEVITEGGTTRLSGAEAQRHTLDFQDDGNIRMQLDCNRGNASWIAPEPVRGENTMTIGAVASTRALCPSPTYGEDLAIDLPTTTNYALSNNNRTLRINARRVSFIFNAQ